MQSRTNPETLSSEHSDFGRMFPHLKPLDLSLSEIRKLAKKMAEGENPAKDSSVPYGSAIFGQFIAHDVTFEKGIAGAHVSKGKNHRTPSMDLDCVYGAKTDAYLYDRNDKAKLLISDDGTDVIRNAQSTAIIGDLRNDENLVVSQMQLLFIKFHNSVVNRLRDQGFNGDVFEEARKLVRWHYQHLVVHEYLKDNLDVPTFRALLDGDLEPYSGSLPVEFTGAAFRQGHSATRDETIVNDDVTAGIFDLGNFKAYDHQVDWKHFFGDSAQKGKLLDTKLLKAFHNIPFIKSDNKDEKSLPFLNIKRGVSYGLPSGEDVARCLGIEPLDQQYLKETRDLPGTPLWFYILREAEVMAYGETLGPVGSSILARTFLGLLENDPNGYLANDPKFVPTFGRRPGHFDFEDLAMYA